MTNARVAKGGGTYLLERRKGGNHILTEGNNLLRIIGSRATYCQTCGKETVHALAKPVDDEYHERYAPTAICMLCANLIEG